MSDPQHLSQASSADIDPDDHIDFMTLMGILWRGKLLILLCMICALGLAVWYALGVAVPTYRASAQMSLGVRTENLLDLEAVLSGVNPDQTSINTEMDVIRSSEIVGRLVDGMNLMDDPEFNPGPGEPGLIERTVTQVRGLLDLPPPEPAVLPDEIIIRNAVINRVRGIIATEPQERSYVFNIAVTTQDPMKSALIANTLSQYYRDDQIALKVDATERAAIWLADRVAELQVEIEEAETEINALRTRNTLISAESIAALSAQSVEVTADLQSAELALRRAQDRVAAFEDAATADYETRAAVAGDAQLMSLSTAAAEQDAAAIARFDRRFNQLLLQLRGDTARAREAVGDLREQVDSITSQFEQQSQALIEIEQTERDTEATRILYDTFLTRLKETSVQVGVHEADSRLLSEATPGYQVAPRKGILLAMSVVLGFIIGAIATLAREALQNTFRSASALERHTGRAVLGQIPRIPARTRADTIAYLAKKPTSAAAEAVRNLRTSILMSSPDRACKVILSTSSIPGEGKTTLAIALAQNLVGLDKKVILIEGDIRRRKFPEYFPNAEIDKGLLSVVTGETPLAQAVWSDPASGIDVLMGQKSSVNAADVLSSAKFTALIDGLRQQYDYVIIDTPPVLVVPDARIISAIADAIVYVVHWDKTTQGQVDDGLKQLRSQNVPITGLVLSQIDPKGMRRYGYSDQYGAYSRFAKGYYEG